jgi:hypothetical protein
MFPVRRQDDSSLKKWETNRVKLIELRLVFRTALTLIAGTRIDPGTREKDPVFCIARIRSQ